MTIQDLIVHLMECSSLCEEGINSPVFMQSYDGITEGIIIDDLLVGHGRIILIGQYTEEPLPNE